MAPFIRLVCCLLSTCSPTHWSDTIYCDQKCGCRSSRIVQLSYVQSTGNLGCHHSSKCRCRFQRCYIPGNGNEIGISSIGFGHVIEIESKSAEFTIEILSIFQADFLIWYANTLFKSTLIQITISTFDYDVWHRQCKCTAGHEHVPWAVFTSHWKYHGIYQRHNQSAGESRPTAARPKWHTHAEAFNRNASDSTSIS